MKQTKEVDEYISKASDEIGQVLSELRGVIGEIPEIKEGFKWGQPVYSVEKDFVYLKATKHHVNLGFFNFELINTGAELLEGTGKKMRHIKVAPGAEIDKETLRKMIEEAKG